MQTFLQLIRINELFDNHHDENMRARYAHEHPTLNYSELIPTHHEVTTAAIKWMLSGDSEWSVVESPPSKGIYEVTFHFEIDDPEDTPIHSMIVDESEDNIWIYQSRYNLHPVQRVQCPHLHQLLLSPNENWEELTGDSDKPTIPIIVAYRYGDIKRVDPMDILSKYESLTRV